MDLVSWGFSTSWLPHSILKSAYIIFTIIYNNVNYDYDSLERQVVNAAERYFNDNYSDVSDTVVVTTTTLKAKGYLNPIYDNRNRECSGYAVMLKNKNIVSYIKCGFYKTAGYSENYE